MPPPLKKLRRTTHTKSRAGCRTCKRRRVKCDETKPYCQRCLSGASNCDYTFVINYSRRNFCDARDLSSNLRPKPPPNSDWLPGLHPSEHGIFQLFRDRTVPEFSGLRSTEFWQNLVLPACYTDTAVLRAALAVSYVYQCRQYTGSSRIGISSLEVKSVEAYNKAISLVNERILQNQGTNTLRVVLITCALFAIMEMCSGSLERALMHSRKGGQLLHQLVQHENSSSARSNFYATENDALYFPPRPESVEDKLVNFFAHMDLQATFLGVLRPRLKLSGLRERTVRLEADTIYLNIPSRFMSFNEANQHLIVLTNECLKFTGPATNQTKHSMLNEKASRQRRYLSLSLRKWRAAYVPPQFSATYLEEGDSFWKSQSAMMLIIHSWLTVIITMSCLEVEETQIDSLLGNFSKIVELTAFVYSPEGEGKSPNRKHFALELGLVSPLWVTAAKCRHPKIRRKALWHMRQMGTGGLLDPTIQRHLALETLLLEEGLEWQQTDQTSSLVSFSHDVPFDENVTLDVFVPLERRISSSTVTLVDNKTKMLQMEFKRKQRDCEGSWTGEFEVIKIQRSLDAVRGAREPTDKPTGE